MHALAFNVHSTLTLPTLAGNTFFLQTIKLPGMGGLRLPAFGSNGPLWSLSNEFWYYLAFPLLALLIAKSSSAWVRVAYALGLIAWIWFVGPEIAILGIPWLLGVLIVFLPPFPARLPWMRRLALSAGIALLAGCLVLGKLLWTLWLGDLILGLGVMFLIWVTLHCATAPLPSTYIRLAQRSAHSSYTLYLVHLPMLVFLKAALHLPRAIPNLHDALISVGLLACVLLYAQIVYEAFEKNTDQARNWLKPHVMGRAAA
jgi:peptidoglycan/LPS O-acetylase OafA/YrhL